MEVIFLGTGTIYPDPERRAPGLALRSGKNILIFDSGPGTWFRLTEAGIDFRKVSALLYSHLHPDHLLDFPAYLFLTHSPDFKRQAPLRVLAPEGFERFYSALVEVFGPWMKPAGVRTKITLLPLAKKTSRLAGLKIISSPVRHSETSLAFRVEQGKKSFVYGGDLEYCSEIIELARGADLLVTECSFPEEDPRPGHLTPSLAGKIAQSAGVKTLALTHFYPQTKNRDLLTPARRHFSGPIILAQDLQKISV